MVVTMEPRYHPGVISDDILLDLRDLDIHAVDVEDLPVDVEDDVAPINDTLGNFTFVPYNSTFVFGLTEDRVLVPLLLAILGLAALVANLMVILAVLLPPRMRSGANLMVLNIALADVVFVLLCVPSAMVNHAAGLGGGPLTDQWCRFIHYVLFVTVYVGIYTLVVICVFRLASDLLETKLDMLLSRTNAVLSSLVIWLAFLVSHINLLVAREDAIFHEPFICMHSELVADPFKMRTLWLTFLACAFLLPLLTIVALSTVFLHNISRLERRHREHLESRSRREFTMLTMTTMLVRTICWLPIQVFVLIDLFGVTTFSALYRKAEMVGVCCAFLGAALNAFVYKGLSREYRASFNHVTARLSCRSAPPPAYPPVGPGGRRDETTEVNETIMSILTDSSNHINYTWRRPSGYGTATPHSKSQSHYCWWPGFLRRQGVRNHCIDLLTSQYILSPALHSKNKDQIVTIYNTFWTILLPSFTTLEHIFEHLWYTKIYQIF